MSDQCPLGLLFTLRVMFTSRVATLHLKLLCISVLAAPLSPEFQLREVYPELLDAVADRISYEFIELGLELCLRLDEIFRFRMKHNDPLQTNREMLREWHSRNKREGKATIAWLAHCLLNTRSDIGALIELEEKAFQESKAAKSNKSGCSLSWHSVGSELCSVCFYFIYFTFCVLYIAFNAYVHFK